MPSSPSSAARPRASSASTSRSRSVRAGSRNVQCQATLRCPAGTPGPRYSSNTSSRSSRGPTVRRRMSDTCAAVTPGGNTSATSRSTGGCSGRGRYATKLRWAAVRRTSNPNRGAAHTGASASRGPAQPTTPPPARCTASQPTAPSVAGSTLHSGAAPLTANSKWYFRSHMSISGTFAPSDQWGGRRAPVRTPATEVHSSGAPAPAPFRKTVPTSQNRISRLRLAQLYSTRRTKPGTSLLVRGVRHGAGAVGAQLVGEGVVPLQPGHFLDQVDLTRHIRTPARDLYGEPPVLRRDEEPHRGEQPLDLGALHLHAKQPADALGSQKDRALLLGRGPEVDRRRAHLTSCHGDDQLDGAP